MSFASKVLRALVPAWFILFPLLPVPEYWVTVGNYIGMYAIVALGLVLLTGVGAVTSFAQGAFVGLGAYTTAYLSTRWGVSPWLGLPAGLVFTGGVAVLVGSVTVRLSGYFLPLATIAWGLALYYLFGTLEFLGRYNGLTGIPALSLGGVDLAAPRSMYGVVWLSVALCLWLLLNLLDSRPGRAVRALASGRVMPEAMGIDTARYRMLIFVAAAMMAGLSGWLYAHLQRTVSASPFGLNMGIEYLFMAVVGGVSSLWGAVLGAAVITGVKIQLQDWLPLLLGTEGNLEIVVLGAVIVAVMIHSRDGLWPWVARQWARVQPAQPSVVPPSQEPPGFQDMLCRARPARGQVVLEVGEASKHFGGLVAVNRMSFQVKAGEVVGLIGPNGAGKSTMFNLITGVLQPTSGEIHFGGERIDTLGSRHIVARGVGRSFQHVRLVPQLSVLENVAMGAHLRGSSGALRAALRLDRREEAHLLFLASETLRRVGLTDVMHLPAGSLSLGQQRTLEIARALCTDPTLLLLDEPAAGLRLKEKQALATLIAQLREGGMSVLIVEHDMDFLMGLADRVVVMEFGTLIAEGTPAQIQSNEVVLAAYLGGVAA